MLILSIIVPVNHLFSSRIFPTVSQVKSLLQGSHLSNTNHSTASQTMHTTEAATNTGQSLFSLPSLSSPSGSVILQEKASLPSLHTLECSAVTSTPSSFLDMLSPDHTNWSSCGRESSPEVGTSASHCEEHIHTSLASVSSAEWTDHNELYLRLKVCVCVCVCVCALT